MIVYKSSDWWEALRHLRASGIIRLLLKRVLFVGLYATAVTALVTHFERLNVPVDKEFFSFLGILLSLLLAFRTNTAYDRFYEGRRLWGHLTNNCRNLAGLLHARLPAHDHASRTYLARLLSNFPIALDGHLRKGVRFEKLEAVEPGFIEHLQTVRHVPSRLAAMLQEFYERLLREEVILPTHLITIQRHHEALLDVAGACERIKGTPIPFSYSYFIKGFVTVFILTMPFNLLDTYVWLTVPITMFGAYALLGVEMIGDEIEDPFGKDSNDLPLTQMSNRMRANVHEILGVELHQDVRKLADEPYSVVF
ncbi:bestrophin family ion channel [Hymenobacter sp. M29]|uniref:Bestrophin family ion channel n=1 Tax=Hymenobacter mellowenesis TaxID=3063995 RepID=A0ABT9A9P6_9BACT|nr:bestrophin family ion channel [Hymenobacter sp. M29]MDO7846568.1 bestrophin family ion channel [Hymenobacter sp. M29]